MSFHSSKVRYQNTHNECSFNLQDDFARGMDPNAKTCLQLECMTGFSNNDRPLLLFSFEFSTITLIYAWIILKTELTLIITNYKYILAGVKGMHRPVDASQ